MGVMKGGRDIAAAVVILAAIIAGAARAQTPPANSGDKLNQLRGIESQIEKSGFEQRRLNYEIDNLSAEQQKLRTALIEGAAKLRAAEERVAEAEARLAALQRREQALRVSLRARERVTAEILAAMQRIGRKPPPALLVRPEDVLSAMRAAILLGAVLPDMRDEAMILVADLRTLVELGRQADEAAGSLRLDRDRIGAERARLAALVETRQSQISLSKEQLESERKRVAMLAREAKTLKELIARSEDEIIGDARAAEIARRVPAPARTATDVTALGAGAGREAARLQPRQAFPERKGLIPLPVSGTITRHFGHPDGLGGSERGITISSSSHAVVTSPADGWVHFAGPYRGYGHLLIINAGSGYHIVLAGMERLSVEAGQFVLVGEPVGFLGAPVPGDAAAGTGEIPGAARPALYIEFRKDGSPVDPSPYWSNQSAEKARG